MDNVLDITTRQIENFFKSDFLDFTNYPDKNIANAFKEKLKKYRTLDLSTISSLQKRNEIRILFYLMFTTDTLYKLSGSFFYFFYDLPAFANTFDEDSFLTIDEDRLTGLFSSYMESIKRSQISVQIIPRCLHCLSEFYDKRTGYDRDCWNLKELLVDDSRKNKAMPINTINFKKISNLSHREFAKKHTKYLISCTDFSLANIVKHLRLIEHFLEHFKNRSLDELTTLEIRNYIYQLPYSNCDKNKRLIAIDLFYKYLITKSLIKGPSPITKALKLKDDYIPNDNLVSDNVVYQIFSHLHELDSSFRCMYLINYCTGMRISDLVQIKLDCLYEDGEDGYYIRFFCQKLQKPLMNLIPHALYTMLQEEIKRVAAFNYENGYLFPALKDKSMPYNKGMYSNKMKKWCNSFNIINDDGTPYNYTTHSYRHTIATDLFQNYNVDLQVIQFAVLGHQEVQMSLVYAQRDENYKKAKHAEYISNAGVKSDINVISDSDTLHRHSLPNGYCNCPSVLGVCPNASICFDCEHFRTSKQFLETHKNHLAQIEKDIIYYRAHNFLPNLETALSEKEKLLTIIKTLENM